MTGAQIFAVESVFVVYRERGHWPSYAAQYAWDFARKHFLPRTRARKWSCARERGPATNLGYTESRTFCPLARAMGICAASTSHERHEVLFALEARYQNFCKLVKPLP